MRRRMNGGVPRCYYVRVDGWMDGYMHVILHMRIFVQVVFATD
jgi:hypothetical protein